MRESGAVGVENDDRARAAPSAPTQEWVLDTAELGYRSGGVRNLCRLHVTPVFPSPLRRSSFLSFLAAVRTARRTASGSAAHLCRSAPYLGTATTCPYRRPAAV